MILKPVTEFLVDCFVDADFTGQWNVQDPQDPLCVNQEPAMC